MIYLVRHGQSEANYNKKYCGITDSQLSPLGVKQANIAALNLGDTYISKIYSSPLKRAYDTAKIICEVNNIDKNKITTVDNLTEINFGIFENMTWEEMRSSNKGETENWIKMGCKYKFPQGESYEDILNRISGFMDKLIDNSLVVTHFGVIQAMLLYYKIADYDNLWDFHISNCDIVVINNKKLENIIKYSF